MITIPIATHCPLFEWQLDLFWFCHRQIYRAEAASRAHAIIIRRNTPDEARQPHLQWHIAMPHTMCEAFFDLPLVEYSAIALPLNIQAGLAQLLPHLHDDQVIEVIDCDMLHFRPRPSFTITQNELLVAGIYEDWHLRSLTQNRYVIEPYFENAGAFYNGGFAPIIGRAGTFKKIMHEWTAIHIDILRRRYDEEIHWWAGMFALQAACEKAGVTMLGENSCYLPGANALCPEHYVAHYSVDSIFDKRRFPYIDLTGFDARDPFYVLAAAWLHQRAAHFESENRARRQ